MRLDDGALRVLGIDVGSDPPTSTGPHRLHAAEIRSVRGFEAEENLDLYADLRGVSLEERRQCYPRLMEMTALGAFRKRWRGAYPAA